MSDILDINSPPTEFEIDEAGDKGINRLKVNARKRKGRGINDDYSSDNSVKSKEYRTIDTDAIKYWECSSGMKKKVADKKNSNPFNDEVVPQKSIEGWVLFITGIHEEANEDEIADKFSEIANIKTIRTNLDRRTGFMKNYAIIEYSTYEDAYQTKEALNGTELLGLQVEINWSFLKGPNKIIHNQY